ncbi:asparagine synthase (glutamine-hydrolyzing) [Streptomyces aureoverticillatus]|uniref:asparagine synthase (glutamine-hydrolyzing) n=1 Tax=Streptomyces aureoverticillatus TaxID=66871 RepID=UPI0013DD5E97|nr:asparagine synthase (glutamine-hydrolyzing) [Streptomyces aureoverticillatus]QIB42671.1 asparagine synthase (glutamine-hydrolyzing) [Streptomyces aureoverticillatus]
MCGIAGTATFGLAPPLAGFPSAALEVMAHRGPDEEGHHRDDQAALGMCRLKVIGLGDGSQPVYSEDRTVVCVLNGEIYNHRALRDLLARRGRQVRGGSDAHVLPLLYDELGEDFVDELHGMFAIALYDTRARRLLLATDRAGKKPLFHTRLADGTVAFASELAALLEHPGIDRTVDPVAVDQYLSYRVVPAPRTIYRQVHKAQPATVLTFEAGQPEKIRRYWEFGFTADLVDLSGTEAVDRVDRLLQEAVADRMESEVPLGAMLSGGLDSSLVVAMASRRLGRRMHTFSVGFEHAAFDESPYARRVAEHCGTEHHTYRIGARDAVQAVDHILSHVGEPYAFPSAIAAHCMYRLAREHVTVVLTGDGSDEIFCGYNRYKTFQRLPAIDPATAPHVDVEALAAGDGGIADRYQAVLVDGVRGSVKDRLYSGEFTAMLPEYPYNHLRERFARTDASAPELSRVMQVDCEFWLPDAQLVKIDRMAMAHSVEPRSPFLDHRLIEFVTRLPPSLNLVGGTEKALLKQVAACWLPQSVLSRRKQELAVPLEGWLGAELRGTIQSALLSDSCLERGYFAPDALRAFVTAFRPENSYALWTLYMLERWHQLHVDGQNPEAP